MTNNSHLWHTVTVTDGKATFECTALYGACHFYPACSCESWAYDHLAEYGHERVHHAECWLQDWFDADAATYTGEDYDDMQDNGIPAGMNRTGHIAHSFEDEWIEWEFTDDRR